MTSQGPKEITLDEWMSALPTHHRAKRQLEILKKDKHRLDVIELLGDLPQRIAEDWSGGMSLRHAIDEYDKLPEDQK